ncbi:MAG: hypothetical protein AAF992_06830 [Bacteroidota bacterium]
MNEMLVLMHEGHTLIIKEFYALKSSSGSLMLTVRESFFVLIDGRNSFATNSKLYQHEKYQLLADAVEDLQGVADEGLTWRVGQAAEARNAANQSALDDKGDGAEDRGAMSDYLQSLIDGEVWVKKRR